jgi:hypothetical protein
MLSLVADSNPMDYIYVDDKLIADIPTLEFDFHELWGVVAALFQCNDLTIRSKWKRNILQHLFYDLSSSLQVESKNMKELQELEIAERRTQRHASTKQEARQQEASATKDIPPQKTKSQMKKERRKLRMTEVNEEEAALERVLSPVGTEAPNPPLVVLAYYPSHC